MQIYLAPMEGITTFIYRNALHRCYGGIDKYFTPFLSSKRLNYKEINEILPAHNEGISLVPQILTNQSETFLAIADQLADYGYREVNLNLGCPSGTVVSRKRGAGFLSVPDLLDAFLEEIFEKCPLAISLKTRIGISSLDEWELLLKIYEKYPVSELIIHPRLQQEFYNGKPHPEAFARAQECLALPLCYNGDITDANSLADIQECLAPAVNPMADGKKQRLPLEKIMLGRGVLANPELPSLLRNNTAAGGDSSVMPTQQLSPLQFDNTTVDSADDHNLSVDDLKRFRDFHDEILAGYAATMSGDRPALFRMKELWSYMGRYLGLSEKQLKRLHKTNSLSEYKDLVNSYF